MRSIHLAGAAVLMVLAVQTLAAEPSVAQTPARSAQSRLAAQVAAYLNPQVATHSFSGSVLIAKGNKLLLNKGYGMADEKKHIADGPNTVFPIKSLTKAFTAVSILQLQEQGKLTVTNRLCRFIAHCPQHWKAITVKQLLTMTSGLPDFSFIPDEDMTSPAKAFAYLGQQKPVSKPGAVWAYNSFSYDLLGFIIQKLSGTTWWTYVRTHIFHPVGMKHSRFIADLATTPNHALSYRGFDTTNPIALDSQGRPPANMSFLDADAAITSTANDLYRWNRALDTTRLLSRADLHSMFTAHVKTNAPVRLMSFAAFYGYGWFIDKLFNHPLEDHRGGGSLVWAYTFRFPDQHLVLIVLSNRPDSPSDIIMTNLSRIALTTGV